ncbi:MAG TPA: cupin domain-containing protein [Burkholderiales bacterium]|nr:cupin domain-containing protein [Burkholderiales bacterium]
MKSGFLAGLGPREFMRRHWQKQPLLARGALPRYATRDRITREDLYTLAARDDIESRIVARRGAQWSVRHGPFTRQQLVRMPRRNWTLLVQGVDQKLPQAAGLLREFAFLPHARLDDVMVSYAAPGGGVGPHFDSYDVFLVQGSGERRWRIGSQADLELVPDLPLKILERFEPEQEWAVQPGDLLYLPPQYAHDGVAVDECITYSVGFRAPAADELASAFLDFLQDRLDVEGRYADPGVTPTREPGRLPQRMVDYAARITDRLRWSRADVERFVGAYLTEPKNNVVFEPPQRPLKPEAFAKRAQARGVRLAAATRMLVSNGDAYINGERHVPARRDIGRIATLADARELPPGFGGASGVTSLLYRWYAAGYIELAP